MGFITTADHRHVFGAETKAQVLAFQTSRGLLPDGICGFQTWTALLEADFGFGERPLYLRQPMLRGEDVAELQRRLGSLGFDAGRIDGIFGPDSARAVGEFQQNVGVPVDNVCGRDTIIELLRVGPRTGQPSVASVRERERLLRPVLSTTPARVVVGDLGDLGALTETLGRTLAERGLDVAIVHHPDGSTHAAAANEHDAAAYVGLVASDGDGHIAYFATDGYESSGGRTLAALLSREVSKYGIAVGPPRGMRLSVLRETRMPAVACRIGPSDTVADLGEPLALALGDAVVEWLQRPLSD